MTRRSAWLAALLMLALVGIAMFTWPQWMPTSERQLTQKDIDKAVLYTLEKTVLPAPEARAFEAVRRSVVRVRQFGVNGGGADEVNKQRNKQANKPDSQANELGKDELLTGTGTGLVIVETGVILTNLHVVAGAIP